MSYVKTLVQIAGMITLIYLLPVYADDLVYESAPDAMNLTAEDYVEIQQLAIRYPWILDQCSNGGYDYADLYVDEGQFSVAEKWNTTSNDQRSFVAKGREELAKAAGGDGKGKCLPAHEILGFGLTHLVANHLITPTKDGAIGRHRLIVVGVCGYPHLIEMQGGYEDVYVRTKKGWRFKSRVHVFSQAMSLQFGPCMHKEEPHVH